MTGQEKGDLLRQVTA